MTTRFRTLSPVAVALIAGLSLAACGVEDAANRDVDTVAFGAYRRDVLQRVGGFDVALVGAEAPADE